MLHDNFGFGVGLFSPSSFGVVLETYFSSLSLAIGVDWGILVPAFSPFLHPKRLGFAFDATFPFLPVGNSADESPTTSVFYTRRLVNGFQARAHMD
jgi:hypothetical protein